LDALADLSSSDTAFNVSSSSTGMGTMFGGGVASSTNSGYLPAPTGVESGGSAAPNQSSDSFFVPGNVSSSSTGGFPGSFPGMGGGGTEDDLDDFDLPPLPDSMEPIQGGAPNYGGSSGSFVTFGAPRSEQK
jgi:hypothetical protein